MIKKLYNTPVTYHTFVYHDNEYSERRCEGFFINGVVVCRQSCFVWKIIKWGYGWAWEMKSIGRKESED